MKTKAFLMFCLFLGIGMTQLSAQTGKGKNETGSVVSYKIWAPYWIPVYDSKGTLEDELMQDEAVVHHIDHYASGEWIWGKCQVSLMAVSVKSGEEFRVHETDKVDINGDGTCHVNLIGSEGSHYIETLMIVNYGDLVFISAKSVGSNK
jgi:hypothetical protein